MGSELGEGEVEGGERALMEVRGGRVEWGSWGKREG